MSRSVDKDDFFARMLKTGDQHAISTLYEQHFKEVVKIIFSLVRDREIAKDLAQELFISIWNNRHNLDLKKSMKNYLVRAAINQSLYYMRRQRRALPGVPMTDEIRYAIPAASAGRPDAEMELKEFREHLHRCIDQLPPTCKVVFLLSRNEHMTNTQISNHMDISVKTVEKHITKALKRLRVALQSHMKILLILILG